MDRKKENRKIEKQKHRGFTLVETLVAVSILSLSIMGTFTAVQEGIRASTYAKDQITAFYLAQEGMEFIKNIRDENALNALNGASNTWLTGFAELSTDACYFGKVCTIDSPLKTFATCLGGAGACPNIRMNTTNGLWGYTGSWQLTNFKREISLAQVSSNEVIVTITMIWTKGSMTKSFQITETLFNRQ